jgi:Putative transposase
MPDGQAVLELRRRWTDGTTHLIFDPVELLERLAALIPRPRSNLVLYHGVLAPRAAWRKRVVRSKVPNGEEGGSTAQDEHGAGEHGGRSNRAWAHLMQRSFGFDVLACPRCSGRLTLVALIRAPEVITRILRHLQLPDVVPVMRPAREPPLPLDGFSEPRYRDDD